MAPLRTQRCQDKELAGEEEGKVSSGHVEVQARHDPETACGAGTPDRDP